MDDPLVSVHIITYNQVPYIAQAIEGALRQRIRFGMEIIIGEDCSTDGTREIVFEYAGKYPELIHAIMSDRNMGPAANSRRVWAACRGKYTAICDGDDYWTDPHKLQKQVNFLEANPEYSLCCHDVDIIFDGVPSMPKTQRYVGLAKNTFSFEDVLRGHFIPTLSIVCRRAWITTLPEWYWECISGDIPLELLLLDRGPGYYMRETMGVKRNNPGSISLDRERAKRATESFLSMYKHLDLHTRGRHRNILHWKIARLSLKLAHQNLDAGRFVTFLRCLSNSIRYDGTALTEAVRRRLPVRREGKSRPGCDAAPCPAPPIGPCEKGRPLDI